MFNLEEAWQDISRGCPEAKIFLRSVYAFVHTQDDLIDRDKPVTPAHSTAVNLAIFSVLGENAFYQKHRQFLWPVFVTSGLAYIASEDLKARADVVDKIASQVLKSQYVDVFLAVAFIIGGMEHAIAMGQKYRDYHFDAV